MVAPYKLSSSDTINTFLSSPAYKIYLKFIADLAISVKGKPIIVEKNSNNHNKVVDILEKLLLYIKCCPLQERTLGRFGNLAFREWFKYMSENAFSFISGLNLDCNPNTLDLLKNYLTDSFGNSTRIDYGSGHEGAFAFLLCCLHHLNYFKPEEMEITVFVVFNKYLELVRCLQKTFSLEPAGSHGSWGLDDFQFLPYIFGASQLSEENHSFFPRDILNKNIVEEQASKNMFFGCINFILQMKKGPFSEHSTVLYSASQSPSFAKVLQGLNKMYINEFLSKYPIVQHFWFGDLMPLYDNSKI